MKTGRTAYDPEFAARVLADATLYGSDIKAADRHKISRKTIERYRVRARTDASLSANVASKLDESERRWDRVRNRGLTVLVERMIELAQTEPDLDKVTNAVEKLGELDIAGGVLGVGSGHRQSRTAAGEAPEGDDPGEDPEEAASGGTH